MLGRVRSALFCVSALLLVSHTQLAAGNADLAFDPTSPWGIDYGEDACILYRDFAAGDQQLEMQIEQRYRGDYFRLTVLSSTLQLSGERAYVRFLPDIRGNSGAFFTSGMTNANSVISYVDSVASNARYSNYSYIGWDVEERRQREAAVEGVRIERAFTEDVILRTGAMNAPMEALRDCVTDMYLSWGVDIRGTGTYSRYPRLQNRSGVMRRLEEVISRADLRKSVGIPPFFSLVIDQDGRIARCELFYAPWLSSASPSLCDIFQEYGRYSPALDAEGLPVSTVGFPSLDSLTIG